MDSVLVWGMVQRQSVSLERFVRAITRGARLLHQSKGPHRGTGGALQL